MKTIVRGTIGFIAIAFACLIAYGAGHQQKQPRPIIIKSAPCPNGGVMYGKEYYSAGT